MRAPSATCSACSGVRSEAAESAAAGSAMGVRVRVAAQASGQPSGCAPSVPGPERFPPHASGAEVTPVGGRRVRRRRFPECHPPAVHWPERFRGGCAFGAVGTVPPDSSAGSFGLTQRNDSDCRALVNQRWQRPEATISAAGVVRRAASGRSGRSNPTTIVIVLVGAASDERKQQRIGDDAERALGRAGRDGHGDAYSFDVSRTCRRSRAGSRCAPARRSCRAARPVRAARGPRPRP